MHTFNVIPEIYLTVVGRWGTGAAGPAFFGLGVKQSLVILLVVDLMYVSAPLSSKHQLTVIQRMHDTSVFVSLCQLS